MKRFYIINAIIVSLIFIFIILALNIDIIQSWFYKKGDEFLGNTIRSALTVNVTSMDPADSGNAYSVACLSKIYEPLFEYHYLKRPYEIIPLLADGMPIVSPDRLTYTIRIKHGIYFQDDPCFTNTDGKGREVTAADFIYSWKRIADVKTLSTGYWIFEDVVNIKGLDAWHRASIDSPVTDYDALVTGMRALDRYTIRITLTRPSPQLIMVLAMPYCVVVPKEAVSYYSEEFGAHPVGTGPYMLTEWVRNARIIFDRNPNYHPDYYPTEGESGDAAAGLLDDAGKRLPFIDRIVYTIIKQDQPYWLKLMNGELDTGGIPKDNYNAAIDAEGNLQKYLIEKGMKLTISILPDITYIAFNMDDATVGGNSEKTRALRQAMSIAYNRSLSLDLFYNNRGLPAVQPIPPGLVGHIEGIENPYVNYDINAARQLLIHAGYDISNGITVTYDSGSDDTTARQMGELFKRMMANIGITVNIVFNTWPQFMNKIHNKGAQIFGIAWQADYPDGQNFLQLFYGPNSSPGPNSSNYDNPEFNQLYERAMTMEDSPARQGLYRKMVMLVNEDCPWIYGIHRIGYGLRYDWVKNYKPNRFNNQAIKYYRIDTAQRKQRIGY